MNPEIFQQLLLAVALAIVSLLGYAARELITVGVAYLKSKLSASDYDRLRGYAGDVVKFLEQSPIYADFDGGKKKELAKVALVQFAQKANLPVDDALFDKFIEAAVKEMNSQLSSIDWVAGEIVSGGDQVSLSGSSN